MRRWQVRPDNGRSYVPGDKEAADDIGAMAHGRFDVPVVLCLPVDKGNSTLVAMGGVGTKDIKVKSRAWMNTL